MTQPTVAMICALGLLGPFVSLSQAPPAPGDTIGKRSVYDSKADGQQQIAKAVAEAKKANKHVLLQVGANWCAPCIQLHGLFETDKQISGILKSNYSVAFIEANERNRPLFVKYRAEIGFGLPFIVILDSAGNHLQTQSTVGWEEKGGHSPTKVVAFLQEWSPISYRPKPIEHWVNLVLEKWDGSDAFEILFAKDQLRERSGEAVSALLKVVQSVPSAPDKRLDQHRIHAYWALAELGPRAEKAVPVLTELFNTNNHLVQFTAHTLQKLGPDAAPAVPALTSLLDDPNLREDLQESTDRAFPRSRMWLLFNAADSLTKLSPADPQLLTALMDWLMSPNIFARRAATRLLGELGELARPALPLLLHLSEEDKDKSVRERAKAAIEKIKAAAKGEGQKQ